MQLKEQGVWQRLQEVLLAELRVAGVCTQMCSWFAGRMAGMGGFTEAPTGRLFLAFSPAGKPRMKGPARRGSRAVTAHASGDSMSQKREQEMSTDTKTRRHRSGRLRRLAIPSLLLPITAITTAALASRQQTGAAMNLG
jgi:hypothetical protein